MSEENAPEAVALLRVPLRNDREASYQRDVTAGVFWSNCDARLICGDAAVKVVGSFGIAATSVPICAVARIALRRVASMELSSRSGS